MEKLDLGPNRSVYYDEDIDAKSLEYLEELSRSELDEILEDAMSSAGGRRADFDDNHRNKLRIERKSGRYILTNRR